MVKTRRAVSEASEPLQKLDTPPKRTQETPSRQPRDRSTKTDRRIDSNTLLDADAALSSSKRSRQLDDDDPESTQSTSKRAKTHNNNAKSDTAAGSSGDSVLFMFPKKDEHDADGQADELGTVMTATSFSERLRRDRRRREMAKTHARLGVTPRRQKLPHMEGDNPFGYDSFTPLSRPVRQQGHLPSETDGDQTSQTDETAANSSSSRSGLFGSLRDLGSAALSAIGSPFTFRATPTKAGAATAPVVHTEPRKRPVRVWDIEYPDLDLSKAQHESPETTESEKKRRAFEAEFGKTDRAYDHLHTIPKDGDPASLPYPLKTQSEPVSRPAATPDGPRSALERRRERRLNNYKSQARELPTKAPLFGPDSHWARGTINPMFRETSQHTSEPVSTTSKNIGEKRAHAETVSGSSPTAEGSGSTSSRTNSFQPYVESPEDTSMLDADGPSTPPPKRQKRAQDIQPPRSAMKLPGTVTKSGRSARFNDNPVASIKRMSPIFGSLRAGLSASGNLFSPSKSSSEHNADDSVVSDPSPRTHNNTIINRGGIHPGDLFTKSLGGELFKGIEFQFSDPQDPEWRPSLANPAPGHFRVPDWDEELELNGENGSVESPQSSANSIAQDTPPRPSTPRMSHAELPKPATSSSQPALSASALEAANLERRLAEASKTKPRNSSRLAEVTSARSRSPSPPSLDTDGTSVDAEDSSTKTPSPVSADQGPEWKWSDEFNEYLASEKAFPDFAFNFEKELVPSFSLKSSNGSYDNKVVGPDKMTESGRQKHYREKYSEEWAEHEFAFDPPYAYETAGLGSAYIHKLIRASDARAPELVKQSDERFALEWNAHQKAIEDAMSRGQRLVATYPDRDGVEMLEEEDL